MGTYFVKHPNINESALVHAPSTEKARTTFLDYLERTGKAPRTARQQLRRNMIAERVKDPEDVTTDLELHYEYEHQSDFPEMSNVPKLEVEGSPLESSPPAAAEPPPQVEVALTPAPPPRRMSPITRVSLGVK